MQWCHGAYHHNTPLFFRLALYGVNIFFSFLGLSQLNPLFLVFFWIFSVPEPFVVSEPRTYRIRHPLGLPLECCSRWYSNSASLFGSGAFYELIWTAWLCISCFQSVFPLYLSPSRTCCFETCGKNFFANFESFTSHSVCMSRFWLVW